MRKVVYRNNWNVKCVACGKVYIDHRRRVGKCLHCKSPAILITRATPEQIAAGGIDFYPVPRGEPMPMHPIVNRVEPFYRQIAHAVINKFRRGDRTVTEEHRERAVRLFCTQSGKQWQLQIRALLTLANGADGTEFVIAGASLSVNDMAALRDAIDALLKEK